MKYRKKPEVVDVVKFTGTKPKEIKDFAGSSCELFMLGEGKWALVIHTPEGDEAAEPGDYIIGSMRGFYPCKPEVFNETYEEAK